LNFFVVEACVFGLCQATERELEDLYAECNFFSLASHMYWAIWAIVQVLLLNTPFYTPVEHIMDG
jgi:hypothetical protein